MRQAASAAEEAGYHRPGMVDEVLAWLAPRPGATIVDATVGGGGHARAILEAILPGGELIGIDRDQNAIAAATERLGLPGARVRLLHGRMGDLAALLDASGIERVDGILADLGVSSAQLDWASRGFSFQGEAPLDMRMDQSAGTDAATLIAETDAEELERIIREYGEERYAGRIARAIKRQAIATTGELAAAIAAAVPPTARHGRIHPATRTFQAIRIAVNDEMGELERLLATAPARLTIGGRFVVMSYHSLEDRRVKHAFRALAATEEFELPVRRVVVPTDEEIAANPRARSAKMRVIERSR